MAATAEVLNHHLKCFSEGDLEGRRLPIYPRRDSRRCPSPSQSPAIDLLVSLAVIVLHRAGVRSSLQRV